MIITEADLEALAADLARFTATDLMNGDRYRAAWESIRTAGAALAALAEDRLAVVDRCTCETAASRYCPRCGPAATDGGGWA